MAPQKPPHGFTIVELVVVLIVVGVMAVVAIPRLSTLAPQERGFRDGVFTTLTHARRVAMASRRYVCVTINGTTVSVTRDVNTSPETASSINCSQAVPLPARMAACAQTNQVCAPNGVTLGGNSSVIFDPQGRSISTPGTVADALVNVNQTSITVAGETGLVQ